MGKIKVTIDSSKLSEAVKAAMEQQNILVNDSVSYSERLVTVDDGLAFYVSQLAQVESKIYEAKYTNINYADVIPVKTDVPEWADEVDYFSYDGVTMGKFIGSSADDLPAIQAQAKKSVVQIGYAGNKYEYSLDELRKSQAMRMPIDVTKGRLAKRGADEHSQKVAYFGDSDRGMEGLFNNSNLPLDNSTLDWDSATGQEIVDDMNSLFIKVWEDSANVHVPNVLLMDSTRFAKISAMQMNSIANTTVLQYFLMNNLYSSLGMGTPRVLPRLQLNNAGVGSVARMMAYELNDDNLSMWQPIPFRALPPQLKDQNVVVPNEYKTSGVEFRYPMAGAYRDASA